MATRPRESPLFTPEEYLARKRYRRHGEGPWLFDESEGPDAEIVLGSIDGRLALREVYEQVL
jgi:hypothetical protein